ncbi:MAG: FimV/HubP family polar landmark protein [Candidatus Sedimenticola sp. (ex Thyasira tokunagai)]
MFNRVVWALVLLWIPFGVRALGLQGIEVLSALNQPLDARITIADEKGDVADIAVSLADLKAFQKGGIQLTFFLSKLQFKVRADAAGNPYIHVTTRESVREPYLNFLIKAERRRGGGVLLKEYTILLDPPIYAPEVTPAAKKTAVPGATVEPEREKVYGPIRGGETLWVIARNTRPDEAVSIEQMMMALQQRNPDAFRRNNVNLLKRGVELVIPQSDLIKRMTRKEAKQAFLDQTREWRSGGRTPRVQTETAKIKPTPEATAVAVPQVPVDEAPTTIETVELAQKAATVESGEGYLRVVETDKAQKLPEAIKVNPADDPDKLQKIIDEASKSLTATRQINQDLAALRVALEGEVAMLQRSLEERDRQIDELRLRIESAQVQVVPEAATQPSLQIEKVVPAPPPSANNAWKATAQWPLADGDSRLVVVVVVLLLLMVLVVLLFRRRRAVVVQTASSALDEDESWKDVGDEASNQEVKKADADVVPSLMMTDVYLGYHQYSQAESMIRQMIDVHPDRLSLKVKLLEIYAVKKDRDMFSHYLEEVHETIASEAPGLWDKVIKMGSDLIPRHPLITGEESPLSVDTNAMDMEKTVDFSDIVVDPELDIELNATDLPVGGGEPSAAEDESLEMALEGLDLTSLEMDEDIDDHDLLLDDIEIPDLEGMLQDVADEQLTLDDLDFGGDEEGEQKKQGDK